MIKPIPRVRRLPRINASLLREMQEQRREINKRIKKVKKKK